MNRKSQDYVYGNGEQWYSETPLERPGISHSRCKIWSIFMHHYLEIMFILPLMTGHHFWKATIWSGLYRGVPLYLVKMKYHLRSEIRVLMLCYVSSVCFHIKNYDLLTPIDHNRYWAGTVENAFFVIVFNSIYIYICLNILQYDNTLTLFLFGIFHVSNSALFFVKYSCTLFSYRRNLDTFYMDSKGAVHQGINSRTT